MKKTMGWVAALSGAATVGCVIGYHFAPLPFLYSLAITCGTVFYHFAMRLAVGLCIHARFHNHMDHTRRWFQPRKWESALYKAMRVRKWKAHVPTFDPATFQAETHTALELVQATCQAEVVHETIMVLSFLPLVAVCWFGSFGVFLLTSVAACLFDGVFVVLQRYNRPRLVRLAQRRGER